MFVCFTVGLVGGDGGGRVTDVIAVALILFLIVDTVSLFCLLSSPQHQVLESWTFCA